MYSPHPQHIPQQRWLAPLLIVMSLSLTGCYKTTDKSTDKAADTVTATQPAASLLLQPCRIKGIDNEVKCATLEVIENRETGQGRKIPLNIVVLPAAARVKLPDPIFVFAGGPGQAATDLGPQALTMMGELNNKRDIVLIDQRGTGKSNGLNCKLGNFAELSLLSRVEREAKGRQAILNCRDELTQKADLTQYTTTIAMADIDEARRALGYNKINLWGGSYGTRSSMEYLRRYPQAVRSVVLDGVAPPSMALPVSFSRDAGAAYEKMLTDCEQTPACNGQFPKLRERVNGLLADLKKQPRKITRPDALTGINREIEVNDEAVLVAIFSALYTPEIVALLPEALTRAQGGDYNPLLTMGALLGDFAQDKIALGMRFSVTCAEDLPRITAADRERENARAPFGSLFIDAFTKSCEIWPKSKMAPGFDTPVQSAVPVLILSGGIDPVTPPIHGEEVKKSLSNSLHLIAPNVGHGVSVRGCAPKLIKKFIETASVAGLDGACLQKPPRPTFYQPMIDKRDGAAGEKS